MTPTSSAYLVPKLGVHPDIGLDYPIVLDRALETARLLTRSHRIRSTLTHAVELGLRVPVPRSRRLACGGAIEQPGWLSAVCWDGERVESDVQAPWQAVLDPLNNKIRGDIDDADAPKPVRSNCSLPDHLGDQRIAGWERKTEHEQALGLLERIVRRVPHASDLGVPLVRLITRRQHHHRVADGFATRATSCLDRPAVGVGHEALVLHAVVIDACVPRD